MAVNLKSFCEQQMRTMEHYQPWIILALIGHGPQAGLATMAAEYKRYEEAAGRPTRALGRKQRLRSAIQNVLRKHGVARIDEHDQVHLDAVCSKAEEDSIREICQDAIRTFGLPRATFVSGGLPSLGKRK
jgi:hypothetical protein